MSSPALFEPITVGDLTLKHRIVMAPLTRFRNAPSHAPIQPRASIYYGQRASEPGTLIISEATLIARVAGGYQLAPGIWSDEHIASWKQTNAAVHAKGSFIYQQLWALGRPAYTEDLAAEGLERVSASDIPVTGLDGPKPRPLTIPEIHEYSQLYALAAVNAVQKADFDGVEVHSGNGYLPNQFLEDTSNKRTDAYGGSIENKARFLLETVEAVTKAIGQKKVGVRLTPWTTWHDSRSHEVIPTYTYVVTQLRERFPDLAYLHVVEPRADAPGDSKNPAENESNDFIRELWRGKRLLTAGGHTPASALAEAETKPDELFVFGRLFLSNPDLPYRIRHGLPAEKGNRDTYFEGGDKDYADYPFSPEYIAEHGL